MANDLLMLGMFGGVMMLIWLALYAYFAFALMTIAKKTDTEYAWLAWIPIANIYLMTQIAEVPWWTMFIIFASIIPFIGSVAVIAVSIWWWWKICERLHKPGWVSLLLLIPLVNLVVVGVLAWGD